MGGWQADFVSINVDANGWVSKAEWEDYIGRLEVLDTHA